MRTTQQAQASGRTAHADGQFDAAVLIGRFMPFHLAHLALLDEALRIGKRALVVLGTAFHSRSARNPFTWQERIDMIVSSLPSSQRDRVTFITVRDYYDNRKWAGAVRSKVDQACGGARDLALVGHYKDASSSYLNLFHGWTVVDMERQGETGSTAIRKILFEAEEVEVSMRLIAHMVPPGVRQYLQAWTVLPCYGALREEHAKLERDRKQYPGQPYVTCDSVIRTRHHVLLVKRGGFPGKGLWALPGGFLEAERRETLYQCARRETTEETGLGVLDSTMDAAFRGMVTFDHPDRSVRERTITHAHYFDLETDRCPEVAGGDDAADAQWMEISSLAAMEDQFLDDHFHILNHFLGLVDD